MRAGEARRAVRARGANGATGAKRARRCEQAAYRIGIKDKPRSIGKEEEYQKLNDETFLEILKEVDLHDEEERTFANA